MQARSLTSWFTGVAPARDEDGRSIAGAPGPQIDRSGPVVDTRPYFRHAPSVRPVGPSGHARTVAFGGDAPLGGPGARGSGRGRDPLPDESGVDRVVGRGRVPVGGHGGHGRGDRGGHGVGHRLDDRVDPLWAPGQGRRADRRRGLHRRRPDLGWRHGVPPGQGHQRDRRLARRHDRPGDDRPSDRRGQSPGPPGGPVRRGRAGVALRAPAVHRLRRHRPLQGGQRLVRPRVGRHRPAGRRPDDRREPPGERPHRPLRRRGVHADPDRDRRRGRRGPEREAAQARRAAAVQRRGQQRPVGHDLDRDRRRLRPEAPDGQPRPGRRCRDVFGQVTRAQPDLHLRGARRGRPRPARPDLRRRTAARHGDRPARARRPPRTC